MTAASAHRLRLGLMLPTHAPRETPLDPALVGDTASWAERAGFDMIWAGDHIVHAWDFLEALTSLAFCAARTSRIGIGTCVLLVPMRQLSILASQVSTLAHLSGGRFELGVGVGGEWPREWQAAGVPMKERGARLDEALALLRRLFGGETIDVEGRFNSFDQVSLAPPPPRIPIHLGGRAPVALERIGREADGFMGFFLTPNGFARDMEQIDAARARAGRANEPFERGMLLNFHIGDDDEQAMRRALDLNLGFANQLTLAGTEEQLRRFALAGRPETIVARLVEYVDAGCTNFALAPMDKTNAGYRRQAEMFAAEILPALRAIKGRG